MTSAEASTTTDVAAFPREGDRVAWLRSWLTAHGFVGIPVDGEDPRALAISMSAEFEDWCEQRGIAPEEQQRARRTVTCSLETHSDLDGDRFLAARDAAAWHALRQRHPATGAA